MVALLERGAPMTLEQVARRLEEAGIAPAVGALASLKRCKPGRPQIRRDGDLYSLDSHDHETDLWAFRLGPATLQVELRTRIGKLCPYRWSDYLAQKVRRMSGIDRFHVHQLRHTFACRWLERGGSLAALQELLGHSSVVTAQRHGRPSESFVLEETRRMEGRDGTKGGTNALQGTR